MKNFDTPKQKILDGLIQTLGKIQSYREYLGKMSPRNGKQIRHEDEKIQAIRDAIAYIERCPWASAPASEATR